MRSIYKLIATSFGAGYLPIAPGTWGAAFGILVLYLMDSLNGLSTEILIAIILIFTILGALVTKQLQSEWGEDPSRVVIDETIGVWISVLFLPFNWTIWIIGFFLFRVFDIWKPLGIRKFEAIPNGWGVMLDDVVAGVYANICLQIIYLYFIK